MLEQFDSRAILANRELHSKLASRYETDEPHFRPENREKVRNRLAEIALRIHTCKTLVDLGCGTGFICELAPIQAKRIIGIDTTPEMLSQLSAKKLERVETRLAPAESTGLPSEIADLVTGYTVLDHFENPLQVFTEASRLLRPGGILYFDLVPNASFWKTLSTLKSENDSLDEIVNRELREVNYHSAKMYSDYGVTAEVLAAAEPHKEISQGFEVASINRDLVDTGFGDIQINREWFLGEARVLHTFGQEISDLLAAHLSRLSPLSDHLFKYLWFTAVKI